MSVRGWRHRGERGWTRSNMQKPWGTLVATVTQFPGASIEVGAPSERAGAPDTVASPPRTSTRRVLATFFFHPFRFVSPFNAAGLKPKGTHGRKIEISCAPGVFFPPTPSSRETSSAKCPTKIGICREYRIPEVRSGLSGELLKVLPRPSNFVFPYWSAFPRIFPWPRCRSCHFVTLFFLRREFPILARNVPNSVFSQILTDQVKFLRRVGETNVRIYAPSLRVCVWFISQMRRDAISPSFILSAIITLIHNVLHFL